MRNSMGGGDVLMLSSVMANDLNMKFLHLENKAKLAMDLANGSSVNLKAVRVVQIDSSRNIPYEMTNILLDHGYSSWIPLLPHILKAPKTRCTEVKIEYYPMHMSQPSKHIHGSHNGSYDRNCLPTGMP
ncbi:hypothetical protein Tco_0080675 [Tanacetum coccineum]